MATNKRAVAPLTAPGLENLEEFKRLKHQVTQAATRVIAEKIEQIMELLRELEQLSYDAGLPLDLSDIVGQAKGIDTATDWNSSSVYCE